MSTNEYETDEDSVQATEQTVQSNSLGEDSRDETLVDDSLGSTGKLYTTNDLEGAAPAPEAAPTQTDETNDEPVATVTEAEAAGTVANDAEVAAPQDEDAPAADFQTAPMPAMAAAQQAKAASIRSSLLSIPSIDEDEDESADADAEGEEPYEVDPITSEPVAQAVESALPTESPFAEGGKGRRVLKIVGIVLGVLLVIYLIGGIFFTSHFMPNTRVNGKDVSWKSVDDLAAEVTNIGASYSTRVTGDGIDLTIKADDINLAYDGNAYGKEAGAQIGPWKWPVSIFGSHDFNATTGITFDSAKLEQIVGTTVDTFDATAQPPTNATMIYDEGKKAFVPVKDALGTMVDRNTTIATVSQGVRTLQQEITLGDSDLTQPVVRVDDPRLAAVIKRANTLVTASVPLRIADRDAAKIDATLLKGWLGTNENCDLIVNVDAIRDWAKGPLSEQFDSVGSTRNFTRPDGKQVTVAGGDYGWNINGDELANIVSVNLQTDNVAPIEVPMKSTAATWNPGGADWGNRYIDVDLSEQYVRVYDENSQVVIESDCVTGIPYHTTDEGVYSIFEHTANTVLVGLDYNGDGQPDYETPVSYWMPFNGGQGLHDAYWRGAFGGDIYTYDGSHGCVNLPSDVAAALFDWAHEGDVVVVHS